MKKLSPLLCLVWASIACVFNFQVVVHRPAGPRCRLAEPCEDRDMTVEDCEAISRHLAAVLDVEDPIEQAYTLEISSPGIDRPLTRETDFTRFAGEKVKVTLLQMQDGQKRFKGLLTGIDRKGNITVETRTGRINFAFSDIDSAKLDPAEYYSKLKQQARRIKPGKHNTLRQTDW